MLKQLSICIFVVFAVINVEAKEYVKVVDGDSLEIGRRRIRLLDIDAPEYKQYCFTQNAEKYDCGKKSLQYLDKILKVAGYNVYCKTRGKDVYNRELAECFAGKKNLNLEMLKAGWAVTYRTDSLKYLNAEKVARKNKKGVWQGKFLRPEYYRKLNKY